MFFEHIIPIFLIKQISYIYRKKKKILHVIKSFSKIISSNQRCCQMINEFFLIFVLFSISLLFGSLLLRIFNWQPALLKSFLWGFTGLLALFHIIAYPLYILKSSFSVLFFVYSIAVLTAAFVSAVSIIRNQGYHSFYNNTKTCLRSIMKTPFLIIVL